MGMGRDCTDILEAVGQISRIQSHAVLAFPSLVRAGWEHASHPDVNVVPIPRQPGMVQSYFKRASWIEEPRPGSQSVQCTWSRGLQPQQSQCTAFLLLVLAMLEIDGFHDYPSQLWSVASYLYPWMGLYHISYYAHHPGAVNNTEEFEINKSICCAPSPVSFEPCGENMSTSGLRRSPSHIKPAFRVTWAILLLPP